MASALLGAAACARCATPVTHTDQRCSACGVVLEGVAAGSALAAGRGPLVGVVSATDGRRRIAVLIDLLLILAVAALAAWATGAASAALSHDVELVALAAVLALLVTLAAFAAVLRASGRTPGRIAAGLRTVDALSGLPPRIAGPAVLAVVAGRGRTVLTADLTAGRDPQAPRLEPVETTIDVEVDGIRRPLVVTAPTPVDAAGARLVFESGDDLVVDGPVLLGRAPEPTRGVRRAHALPDLSRGIARTHLLVDWSNGLLWVTDLGSPGGTTIRSDAGTFQLLVPEVRTAVAPGWQLRLGGRTLTVRSVAVEEGVRRG